MSGSPSPDRVIQLVDESLAIDHLIQSQFDWAEPNAYIHGVPKIKNMNKKEIVRAITYKVCEFAQSLGYTIDDDGFGGRLQFMKPNAKDVYDGIEWSRSYQESVCVNWASDETKADCEKIDAHMKPIIEHYNAQYIDKRKKILHEA